MHNLLKFSNVKTYNKPSWNPLVMEDNSIPNVQKIEYDFYSKYPVYIADNFVSEDMCNDLIKQFTLQEKHPVGVDGYCDSAANVGSYRANAWAEELSMVFSHKMKDIVHEKFFKISKSNKELASNGVDFSTPFLPNSQYELLGSTPFMRFMQYKSGGMHTPHHDAPYINNDENYTSLFSWVLYLNTPDGTGGGFQFVDDLKQRGKHPSYWDTSDWTHMSPNVTLEVRPVCGRLLIFPHWLCHQVEKFIGEGYRYIIRGDLAYAK
jgi:hypothetical protein